MPGRWLCKRGHLHDSKTGAEACEIVDLGSHSKKIKLHETEKYFRERVRAPSQFVRSSFRTKAIGAGGTKIVVGRLKGTPKQPRKGRLTLQAILHPKG